jgi:protein-serine/threonine kinase
VSGGELFDHILANKYLKERDAQKLFAQLISGVDYLHKRHIVHRDLKLENLLLDKHRNIIITDFGFANRFDHAADDLMATSCGSPCYAAPELVVSEGLYVGSAVDIWSCGVILYAMLSGYLPYDDDPSNPDGDNINLLYKYIMSTKLNFPDHLSALAKDLLQIMLVPNPEYRCSIKDIMEHPWLYSHREIFQRSVEMNEYIFQENMYRKSQQAKRDLGERRRIQQEAKMAKAMMQRSQSSVPGTSVTASMLDARRTQRHHSALPTTNTIPDYLANAGRAPSFGHPLPSAPAPLPAKASPIIAVAAIMPTAPTVPVPLPPTFREPAIPPRARLAHTPTPSQGPEPSTVALKDEPMDVESQSERPPMSQNKNRHTIQVEYDGDASYEKMKEAYEAHTQHGSNASVSETPEETPAAIELLQATMSDIEMASGSESGHVKSNTAASLSLEGNMPDASQILTPAEVPFPAEGGMTQETNSKATVPDGQAQTDTPLTPRASTSVIREDILATPRAEAIPATAHKTSLRAQGKRFDSMPSPVAPLATTEPASKSAGLAPMGLPKVPPPKRDRYRKGMSLDKFGLAKLLGQATASSSIDVSRPPSAGGAAATLQQHAHAQNSATEAAKRTSMVRPRTGDSEVNKDKKSRRRTLQLITNRYVRSTR